MPSGILVLMICSLNGFPAKSSRASSLVTTRRSNFCFDLVILATSCSTGLSNKITQCDSNNYELFRNAIDMVMYIS